MIKEILSDVDGTLVYSGDVLDDSTRHMLKYTCKRVMDKGLRIGLISGRAFGKAKDLYDKLSLNGALVVENGAAIAEHPDEIEDDVYCEYQHERRMLRQVGGLSKDKILEVKELLEQGGFIGKMRYIPNREYTIGLFAKGYPEEYFFENELYDRARINFPDLHVTRSSVSIEIADAGIDKGKGVEEYAKMRGLRLDEIAVLGDAGNDESMFRVVLENGGLGFFVGEDVELRKWVCSFPGGYGEEKHLNVKGTMHYLSHLDFFEFFTRHRKNVREDGLG